MIYLFIKNQEFTKEMQKTLAPVNEIANGFKVVRFKSEKEIPLLFKDFKRYTSDEYKQVLISINNGGIVINKAERIPTENYAIANNKTVDGKTMYIKVHGQKAVIPAGESYIFEFQIPYEEVYYFGAEIMQNIVGVTNFDVFLPSGLDENGNFSGVVAEQYGFNVNIGELIYIRETPFGARLPQGIVVRSTYTNDTNEEKEIGVNFLMNELKVIT